MLMIMMMHPSVMKELQYIRVVQVKHRQGSRNVYNMYLLKYTQAYKINLFSSSNKRIMDFINLNISYTLQKHSWLT
jgi:hypothetical protein